MEEVMKRVPVLLQGEGKAAEAMLLLLEASQSFDFMPLPDGLYRISVWPDVKHLIRHLEASCITE